MIKLEKCDAPELLKNNAEKWTKELMEAVNKYGSYKEIPEKEKKKLISFYNQDSIKIPLFKCSHNKCAFCECRPDLSGHIEVEHFAPKSKYPEKTFEWDNLLPVCRRCNDSKSAHDTIAEPIINPFIENPENYLEYNFLNVRPKPNCPDAIVAQRTIDICNLNRVALNKERANLMCSLTQYLKNVASYIDYINEADTPLKKRRRLIKLQDSIENIEINFQSSNLFSGFCKWFVSTQEIYTKAKKLIAENAQTE